MRVSQADQCVVVGGGSCVVASLFVCRGLFYLAGCRFNVFCNSNPKMDARGVSQCKSAWIRPIVDSVTSMPGAAERERERQTHYAALLLAGWLSYRGTDAHSTYTRPLRIGYAQYTKCERMQGVETEEQGRIISK